MVGRTGVGLQEGPGCLNHRGRGRGAFGPQGEAVPSPPPPLVHSWLGPPAVSQQPLGPLGKPKPLAEACPVPNPLCP